MKYEDFPDLYQKRSKISGTQKHGNNKTPRTAMNCDPSTVTKTSNNLLKSHETLRAHIFDTTSIDATSVPLIRRKPAACNAANKNGGLFNTFLCSGGSGWGAVVRCRCCRGAAAAADAQQQLLVSSTTRLWRGRDAQQTTRSFGILLPGHRTKMPQQ